ncbi:plastocyanin/azurin family copper-binding protein [Halobaculum roseum]|uniref:Plastocyanin/azurin family copper-binding protein n=1 Tax=Halobaculum roseum TaxID=2175149 RepID=A0ABD5MKU4_9EURY|nr:plastocyanin/azurin family copper-binding protein [Halobaculum roseum]QZY02266.1 halocyanin [Halobaculum roseum]
MEDDTLSRRSFIRGAAGATAAAGAVAAGSGTAAAQATADGEGTVEVGAGSDGLLFTPGTEETFYVTPGTTVTFEWVSGGHNIAVNSQPDGAGWEGHTPIEDEGFSTEFTFETVGVYEYVCEPHASVGMEGTIEVVEQLPTPTPTAAGPPEVPDSAKSLGIASFIAMVSTLGLAFFFTKYGGDYEPPEE